MNRQLSPLAVPILLLSGCGTLLNVSRPHGNPSIDHTSPAVYGGVGEDLAWAWQLISDSPGESNSVAIKLFQLAMAPCVLGIDLPLSVVGDTLTLPITVRSVLHEQERISLTEGQVIDNIGKLGGHVNRTDNKAPNRPVMSVDLSGTKVTEEDLKQLAVFPELWGVCLDDVRVTAGMLKMLSPLQSLRSLSLSRTTLGNQELKQLAGLVQIQRLHLVETTMAEGGMKDLVTLQQLDFLNLSRSSLCDADMKELATFKHLSSLTLSFTKVTDAGLQRLAPLKELRYLELTGTKVTEAGMKKLRDALPGCLIEAKVVNPP